MSHVSYYSVPLFIDWEKLGGSVRLYAENNAISIIAVTIASLPAPTVPSSAPSSFLLS